MRGVTTNLCPPMNNTISKKKLRSLSASSLANSIQLHLDSIVLFGEKRYSSAFYLSVIAMEEMAKAKRLEHYFFYYTQNQEHRFEQAFLSRLYDHSSKQRAFIGHDLEHYSPKYYNAVENRQLDQKKLKALYVGLDKKNKLIDTKSKISRPSSFKSTDAKQQISVFNDELKHLMNSMNKYEYYFFIPEMDCILSDTTTKQIVDRWKFKSGIRSKKWWPYWRKRFASPSK